MAKDLKKASKRTEKLEKRVKKKTIDKDSKKKTSKDGRKLDVPFLLEKRPKLKIDDRKTIDGKEQGLPEHRLAEASASEEEKQKLEETRLTEDEKTREIENHSGTKHNIYPPNRGPPVYNERKPPLPGYGGIQGRRPARRCSTCGEYHLRCVDGYSLKRRKTIEQDRIRRHPVVKPGNHAPNTGGPSGSAQVQTVPIPPFRPNVGEGNALHKDKESGGETPPPLEKEIPCEPRLRRRLSNHDSDDDRRIEKRRLKRNESIDSKGNCVIIISDSEDDMVNEPERENLKRRRDSLCGETVSAEEGEATARRAECEMGEVQRDLSDASMDYSESDCSETYRCHVHHFCNNDDWVDYSNESSVDTPINDAESNEEMISHQDCPNRDCDSCR